MVRGQVATIPSGTGVLLTTLSREEKASMAILNPNDGVIYLKMNSPASIAPTNWDWKLPSQSYGQYPGPWQSLGLYYQDQSGSNAAGQVNLYESDAELAIPSIVAIGRAAQVAGTQVDITQGTIPQNPPQSTTRLWVDTSGHLHLLDSTGSDKTVVDSNNISSYVTPLIAATALGGDLYGTIPNGHVWAHTNPVQLDRTVNVQWGTNSSMDRITVWSDTNMYVDVTGNVNIRPGGTTALVVSSSGINVTGSGVFSTTVQVGGTGTFQNNAITFVSDTVIQRWNPGQVRISSGGLTVNGQINVEAGGLNIAAGGIPACNGLAQFNSTLQVSGGNQIGWNNSNSYSFESSYLYFRNPTGFVFQNTSSANNVPILVQAVQFVDSNVRIYRPLSTNFMMLVSYDSDWQFQDAGGNARYRVNCSSQEDHYGNNGATNVRFFHHDSSWMGTQAANFQVQSSVRHAELYKKPIEPISNAAQIVLDLDPVYYYHVIMKEDDTPLDEDLTGYTTYGFSPTQMASVVPEVVNGDFIDYNRLIPILWQAVKELVQKAEPKVVNTP